MVRRLSAFVAVLGFMYGFSAAPYTHAHHALDSGVDALHRHGESLVHTHVSPHLVTRTAASTGPQAAGPEDRTGQIWSVDSFVFQKSVPSHVPSPVLQVCGEPYVKLTGTGWTADLQQPRAHGPPVGSPSGLRAPPTCLPTLA